MLAQRAVQGWARCLQSPGPTRLCHPPGLCMPSVPVMPTSAPNAPAPLVLRHADGLVTMDAERREIRDGAVVLEGLPSPGGRDGRPPSATSTPHARAEPSCWT